MLLDQKWCSARFWFRFLVVCSAREPHEQVVQGEAEPIKLLFIHVKLLNHHKSKPITTAGHKADPPSPAPFPSP